MTEPFDRIHWPVRTDRLLLRPLTAEDADAMWHYRSMPGVHEWLGTDNRDRAVFDAKYFAPGATDKTLVVERGTVMIGDLYLEVGDGWSQQDVAAKARNTQGSIGWVIDPAFSRQGYATEAAGALLKICFEGLGLRRVVAHCFADNEPSWQTMERLGMRRETHAVADSLHRDRGWLDGYAYSLLADEWREDQD